MCLDKDILHKGNKIYGPDSCCIIPTAINCLFTGQRNRDLPLGVSLFKRTGKYCVSYPVYGSTKRPKVCKDTPEEAFQIYKINKEKYIKCIADEYKQYIPKEVYDALYEYEVEITD